MKLKRKWHKDPDELDILRRSDQRIKTYLWSEWPGNWILMKHDSGWPQAFWVLRSTTEGCALIGNRLIVNKEFTAWAQREKKLYACDHLPYSIKTQREAIAYANRVIAEWEEFEKAAKAQSVRVYRSIDDD